jgi:heme/copper-type cytochrome/quinol oxidase subunit 4
MSMAENDEPIHVSTDRARAGTTPHMTRYVLGFGLALVIIVFAFLLWS